MTLLRKTRVLVVDDTAVVRKLLDNTLAGEPDIEVVGLAANGRIALEKIEQTRPDLVTLDIEMPEMDGLETLERIRELHPGLPVIMFSTLTERGAAATLDALSRGASDYATKPTKVSSLNDAIEEVRQTLVPKIRALCAPPVRVEPKAPAPPRVRSTPPAKPGATRIDLVAIGVSTGGPNALAQLFAGLPSGLPVPVLVVQHMPPTFTALLADRLAAKSAMPVCEGRHGAALEPGSAWIAPGDFHMTIARHNGGVTLQLGQGPKENSCRPAVDTLFRSIPPVYGAHVLAVMLTGMGQDGLQGCERIHEAGGEIFAQDEGSSVVWGMPGAVVRAGLATRVLPLEEMAAAMVRRVTGRSER